MYLEDNLIDSVPVRLEQIGIPGFLEGLKRELEEKHHKLLEASRKKPVFFVDNVPSSFGPK